MSAPDLDAARREAEEALRLKATCTAMNCITCEPKLLHAIDALLAATAPSAPPASEVLVAAETDTVRSWRLRALDAEMALRMILSRADKYREIANRSGGEILRTAALDKGGAQMTLDAIIAEGRRLQQAATDHADAREWGEACRFSDLCHAFYIEHGPRLLAVAEAAVEMRRHSAVPDHWCPEDCTFCESIAVFDAAASAGEKQ